MLFRLILFRLGPLAMLKLFKERNKLKLVLYLFLVLFALVYFAAVLRIFYQEQWGSIWLLIVSMFPQCFFYGFAGWMILRCVRSAWSKRVWRRIYTLSFLCVLCGILAELYINPLILKIFVKNI